MQSCEKTHRYTQNNKEKTLIINDVYGYMTLSPAAEIF